MASIFYKDSQKGQILLYEDILDHINNHSYYRPYFGDKSEVAFYLNLIKALTCGQDITILDLDFSDNEISDLIGDVGLINEEKEANTKLTNLDELVDSIYSSGSKITLFTSGTTGKPKKVTHNVSHFLRSVRISELHKADIWGFCYNPTHMAGLQVFFQAFLNRNLLISLFNKSRSFIFEQLANEKITNISATPTFYRLLLPIEREFSNVKRVTLGGERSDKNLIERLQSAFPNAKLSNIYASTEAGSLFLTSSDEFKVTAAVSEKVKVIDNELVIHSSLLGAGDFAETEWYHTGDIIEVLNSDPLTFRFLNRSSEFINIGGHNVNPAEVEGRILEYPGVLAVKVYGKPNSVMGNLLMADVLRENNSVSDLLIKAFVMDALQIYKVPRIIKFVDEIQTTRTGKVLRKPEL